MHVDRAVFSKCNGPCFMMNDQFLMIFFVTVVTFLAPVGVYDGERVNGCEMNRDKERGQSSQESGSMCS